MKVFLSFKAARDNNLLAKGIFKNVCLSTGLNDSSMSVMINESVERFESNRFFNLSIICAKHFYCRKIWNRITKSGNTCFQRFNFSRIDYQTQ